MNIYATILKRGSLLSLLILFLACIEEESYEVPLGITSAIEIPESQIITIEALRSAWSQELTINGNQTYTFGDESKDQFVEGYVISSDESGNYFEEVVLQDKTENPSSGVKVLIDSSPLFNRFDFGRRVYVRVQGLTVGLDSGVLALGYEDGGVIKPISEALMSSIIKRDTLVAQIMPKEIFLEDVSTSMVNLWVRIDKVQFHRSEVLGENPLTYAGEPFDEFDGERILESCMNGSQLIFSTSTFSNFKSQAMDLGKGAIDGILAMDYYGEYLVLKVNGLGDLYLEDENRCDPEFFYCEGTMNGNDVLWEENFEEGTSMEHYVNEGWTNTNLNGGETVWSLQSFSGNNYAQITGYNSGETAIDSWLITPQITMQGSVERGLYLDIQTAYYNQSILNVWVTQEFSGDVLTTDWKLIDVFVPTGPTDGFGEFQTVGPINLSCLEGTITIGFQYEGSDPSATTRYHLDNIRVKGY